MLSSSCDCKDMTVRDAECFMLSRMSFSMGTNMWSVKRHSNLVKPLAQETLLGFFLIKFSKKHLVLQTHSLRRIGKNGTFRPMSVVWSKIFLWSSFLGNRGSDHGISVSLLCCSQQHEMITKKLLFTSSCLFSGTISECMPDSTWSLFLSGAQRWDSPWLHHDRTWNIKSENEVAETQLILG